MILLSLMVIKYRPLPLPDGVVLVLIAYLVSVTIIDLEHRLILHSTSIFGGFLSLGIGIWLHGTIPTLVGGLAGFGTMLTIYLLGIGFVRIIRKITRRAMVEQEAIGFGDVILSGVIGLLLGWPGINLGIFLAVIIGGIVSLIVLVWNGLKKSYHPDLAIPYGPFLTLSAFILLFQRFWLA